MKNEVNQFKLLRGITLSESRRSNNFTPEPFVNVWIKIINTFSYPKFLWNLVISNADIDAILEGKLDPGNGLLSSINRLLRKFVWFWPRVVDARIWTNEKNDPAPFRNLYDDSQILVRETFKRLESEDAAILDIGCSCGRHLAALADLGCTNLHGVDVNSVALDVMFEWFPQLQGACVVKHDLIQRYLSETQQQFDIVITRGATVELVHPSFPLVKEIAKVTKSYVILLIQENGQGYSRFWAYEFAKNGFTLTKLLRPVSQEYKIEGDSHIGQNSSLLIFKKVK